MHEDIHYDIDVLSENQEELFNILTTACSDKNLMCALIDIKLNREKLDKEYETLSDKCDILQLEKRRLYSNISILEKYISKEILDD